MRTSHNKIWDLKKVKKIAKKYNNRSQFKKENKSAYSHCVGNQILDIVCGHMTGKREKWTYEKVQKIANKYHRKKDFEKYDNPACQWATRNKKIIEICSHMEFEKQGWDKNSVLEEAKNHKSKKDFKKNGHQAYVWCCNNNFLEEACKNMTSSRVDWNIEKVLKITLMYNTKTEFKKSNAGAYTWCVRNNQLDNKKLFGHMYFGNRGFNSSKPAILYYLRILGGTAYKIGITNYTVEDRFCKNDLNIIEIIHTEYFEYGLEAYAKEQNILNEFKYAKYTGDSLLANGNTELFYYDVLDLDLEGGK